MISIYNLFESKTSLDLVDLKQFNFKLSIDLFNPKILLTRKAAQSLHLARKMLPPNYNFVISSGYRGYDDQVKINEYMKKKLKKKYPNNWEEQLNIFTGGEDYLKYLRTHKGKFSHMSHTSGNAVDIVGIIDGDNKSLDLGGQTISNKDRLDYYEKTKNPKEIIIRDNRRLLKEVLTKNGFEGFKDEWWHWGYYK